MPATHLEGMPSGPTTAPTIDRHRTRKTPISEDQSEPGIAGALAAAPRFGLKDARAKEILR
ncbi:MAG: hypothetical protein IT577_16975 [Verrucomicrobiae bacterium]|nr:hypothetical protein [Verrucomicrobiae bacterium]